MAREQWTGKTYGNDRMHRHLVWVLSKLDRRILYVVSNLFIVPVSILVNPSRKSSYRFFRDALHYGRLKAAWHCYLNHCKFSEVVIDRFAMYAGRKFETEVVGLDIFENHAARPEGFLMLSSHIGNYEIAGYSLVSERKCIRPLVFAFEKESVMRNRNNMFAGTNVQMIALEEDMSHLFEIDRTLTEGNIVSCPTDRFMGQTRCVEREFFGRNAKFPLGPFSIATMRGLDALAVKYIREVIDLPYDRSLSRKEQIRQLSCAYVSELETRLRQYPDQWYNFYDFWK